MNSVARRNEFPVRGTFTSAIAVLALTAGCAWMPGGETAGMTENQQAQANAAAKAGARAAIDTFVRLERDPQCTVQGEGSQFTDCRASQYGSLSYEKTVVRNAPWPDKPARQTEDYRRIWVTGLGGEQPTKLMVQSIDQSSVYPNGGRTKQTAPSDRRDPQQSLVQLEFSNIDRRVPDGQKLDGPDAALNFINDPYTEVTLVKVRNASGLTGVDAMSGIGDGVLTTHLGPYDAQYGTMLSDREKRAILAGQLQQIPVLVGQS